MSNGVGKQNGDILDRDELNFPRLPHGIGTVPLASGTATQFTIITTAVAKSEFTYDPATLAVDTETISYDLDATAGYEFFRVLDRSRDALGHDTGFILGSTPAPGVGGGAPASTIVEAQAAYAYSPTDGRIAQISNPQIPNQAFIYQYLPNSDLIEKVTGPIHTVTNSWEPNRDVLDFKQNKVGTTIISSYDYAVNAIGQRTGVATSGTAYPALPSWLWSYDALGQVTSADSSIATSDRAYQYDAIGNRQKTANSLTLPVANNYTANSLNQYTSLPSLASVPSYDFDGNMTSGPLPVSPTTNSTLLWDGENRLTEVKNSAGTIIEKNIFDSGSRKIATTANGVTTIYLYDGWNCIAEYQGDTGVSPVLKKTRLWGTDLSGSMQGAGGVGGILSESSPITSNPITFNSSYPTYDGNGNVSEYLNSTGQVTAHFEYDPFGNTVVNTDTSNLFTYRFSTKPISIATGLYYYGYRYYDPMTGRWPSRDPIGENGLPDDSEEYEELEFVQIANLYAFGPNSPLNGFDHEGEVWGAVGRVLWNLIRGGARGGGKVKPPAPKPPVPKPPAPKPKPNSKPKGCKPCVPAVGSMLCEVAAPGSRERGTHKAGGGKDCGHCKIWTVLQQPAPGCGCFWSKPVTIENCQQCPPGANAGGPPTGRPSGGGPH